MLAMPFSMILIGIDEAKAVLNAIAIVISLLVVIKNPQHVDKKETLKMTVFMLIGMAIGIYLLGILPTENLIYAYGVLIIAIALKKLLVKKEVKLPVIMMYFVIIAAGIIHGMFVTGGTLLVIYAVYALKDKHEFRTTLAVLWIILNSILLAGHIQSGVFTTEITILTIGSIPIALFSVYMSNKILNNINQELFLKITYVLLLISGCMLLI